MKPGWNPLSTGLMILGFIAFWPLGLAMLAYILWGDRMRSAWADARPGVENAFKSAGFTRSRGTENWGRTGNVAFDEYRERELKRLEEERQRIDAMRASSTTSCTTCGRRRTRRSSTGSCPAGTPPPPDARPSARRRKPRRAGPFDQSVLSPIPSGRPRQRSAGALTRFQRARIGYSPPWRIDSSPSSCPGRNRRPPTEGGGFDRGDGRGARGDRPAPAQRPRQALHATRRRPRRGRVVTIPRRGTIAEARAFVARHADWLAERIVPPEARPAVAAGSRVPLRGVPHRLVPTGTARGTVRVSADTEGEPILLVPGDPAHLARRVEDHLKRLARADLAAPPWRGMPPPSA